MRKNDGFCPNCFDETCQRCGVCQACGFGVDTDNGATIFLVRANEAQAEIAALKAKLAEAEKRVAELGHKLVQERNPGWKPGMGM